MSKQDEGRELTENEKYLISLGGRGIPWPGNDGIILDDHILDSGNMVLEDDKGQEK